MFYPTGSIVENMYVDASNAFPTIALEGCVFVNVTFMNPAIFGKGCIFTNCIFLDGRDSQHSQMHETGEGNIFHNCQFNYVRFGANNVSNLIPVGFRPNIIGINMEMGSSSDRYPEQTLKSCPVCGKVHVVHNGDVVASENMINDNEQVMGGTDIQSSGVCDNCG